MPLVCLFLKIVGYLAVFWFTFCFYFSNIVIVIFVGIVLSLELSLDCIIIFIMFNFPTHGHMVSFILVFIILIILLILFKVSDLWFSFSFVMFHCKYLFHLVLLLIAHVRRSGISRHPCLIITTFTIENDIKYGCF